jgi:hypothetical protein
LGEVNNGIRRPKVAGCAESVANGFGSRFGTNAKRFDSFVRAVAANRMRFAGFVGGGVAAAKAIAAGLVHDPVEGLTQAAARPARTKANPIPLVVRNGAMFDCRAP